MKSDKETRDRLDKEPERRYSKKTRPVRIIETGQVFRSAAALAEYLGVSSTTVSTALNKGSSVSSYTVEYVGEMRG